MKLLTHLFSLVRRHAASTGHDDNLRAGKDTAHHTLQPARWNGLLL